MSRQIRLAFMSVLLAATSISAQPSAAQQPSTPQQPPTTFKSGSGAIVSIFATVSDADRRLVDGVMRQLRVLCANWEA